MRTRKQAGQIIRIGDSWYVRYWERRNIAGNIERKRVTHQLAPVTTRGKRAPADIEAEAEKHMHTINSGNVAAERILTVCDFVAGVYLPWIEAHKRPSTLNSYRDIWEDHLKARCGKMWLKQTRTFQCSRLAERHCWLRRSRDPQPEHAETHQKRSERDFHVGEAA